MAAEQRDPPPGPGAAALPSEAVIHSFTVTITVEESGGTDGGATWHGRIKREPNGRPRYFRDLHAIVEFIAPFLEAMGIRTGAGGRVRRWLKGRR